MRIIHLIPAINKGGTERLVLTLAHHQMRLGHTVKVIAFGTINYYPNLSNGLDIAYLPNISVRYRLFSKPIANTEAYSELIKTFKPDIINSHALWTDMIAHYAYHIKASYISHLHLYYKDLAPIDWSKYLQKQEWVRLLDKYRMMRRHAAHNSLLISVSEDIEDYYLKSLPFLKRSNSTCLKNGIDLSAFTTVERKVDLKKIKLISIASIKPIKNHAFLVKVISWLKKADHEVQLQIAGVGPLEEKIQNQINQLGLEQQVQLLGRVDDVQQLYHANNIYVHSAVKEPFGLTMLEALATGLPVVALDAGGNRDIVHNDENGYLIEDHNAVEEFAKRILQIAQNDTLYQRLAKTARASAQRFSMDQYAQQLDSIYQKRLQ